MTEVQGQRRDAQHAGRWTPASHEWQPNPSGIAGTRVFSRSEKLTPGAWRRLYHS
jgi:hypothetical protein